MKKISTIVMALVMIVTMAQCKKNEEINQDKTVTITLDVKGNNGSKVVVNPATGTVNFETGDKVYVGSGSKYVGMLTHNGTNFTGNITNPIEGQPLQFYFLGNVTPNETLAPGTTEECSVVISDQTAHLPVISTGASYENYVSGVTAYTGHLLNKCALVKFSVTTPSTAPVCVTGMYNKVTVDFTSNAVAFSQDGDGTIMLPAGAGFDVEKWAIVLPQPALQEGEEGSVYSGANYTGVRPAIPEVLMNSYWQAGIGLEVATSPVGTLKRLFTINAYGNQVFFSQGNLQYIGSASEPYWQFAEHQWDYIGSNAGQNSDSQTADRDLFGWGTSGYNHGAIAYQPWATSTTNSQYYAYGDPSWNLYAQTGQADWGYNAIANGGNQENSGWRTLTFAEWDYVLNTRTDAASKYGHGNVNGVNGLILLPDEWTLPEGLTFTSGRSNWANVYNSEQWAQMEAHGAVFLPAAGNRGGTSIHYVGNTGRYWSSSRYNANTAYKMEFSNNYFSPSISIDRFHGNSVRLVRPAVY